jgi:hypothetical protein
LNLSFICSHNAAASPALLVLHRIRHICIPAVVL